MKLTDEQKNLLKGLMVSSARKGNLATSALVLEEGKILATSESLVGTNFDMTSHAERMLVSIVGKMKGSPYIPGLTMITVVESCLMCLSACSQAGFSEIYYIIPAKRYVKEFSLMTDVSETLDKNMVVSQMSNPIKIVHLSEYEDEFCKIFEPEMAPVFEKYKR